MLKKSQPLVSVIIPTYNRADLVVRALDSVTQQTYKNLEIIFIDDASTDNTEVVIKAIDDFRIRYIRHQTNEGGAKARNTGIEAATGEYIAFLDSDDVWLPKKIEWQVAAIDNNPDSEKIVSYTQFKLDTGSNISILPSRGKNQKEPVADYLFVCGGEILTSTLMMPRTLASATKFRPELRKHQDLDFSLRLEASGAIFNFLEEPLTVWYDEHRSDRISKLSNYQLSLNWVREYQGSISVKATKGFLIKEVVPKLIDSGKSIYAERLIIDAALHGILSAKEFARLSAWALIPTKIRQKLKAIGQKIIRLK